MAENVLLLPNLPYDLLFSIFYKMDNLALVRMRRTCSVFNSLVEKNSKKFSSRCIIGSRIKMTACVSLTRAMIGTGTTRDVLYLANLSGISIGEVKIIKPQDSKFFYSWHNSGILLTELVLSCDYLNGHFVASDFTLKMADMMEVRERIDFRIKRDSETLALLTELGNVGYSFSRKYRSKAEIFSQSTIFHGIFTMINGITTQFDKLSLSAFQSLIWEIFNSKETVSLSTYIAGIYPENHAIDAFENAEYIMPKHTVLWKRRETSPCQGIPKFLRLFKLANSEQMFLLAERDGNAEIGKDVNYWTIGFIADARDLYLECVEALRIPESSSDVEFFDDDFKNSSDQRKGVCCAHFCS